MTKLSVNINKIALLRNSRGRNFPDVNNFATRCLDLGAHGITLHPRQDQRHALYQDVEALQSLCISRSAELNVEGFPSAEFLEIIQKTRPAQCTLVPDLPGQLTSDHGWNLREHGSFLRPILANLKFLGIRTSLFVDFDNPDIGYAKALGADRIELYTEPYALAFGTSREHEILEGFKAAALHAKNVGLGINAGHDLNLVNLPNFLKIPSISEVSIGHALIVECLEHGIANILDRYIKIFADY
ncbi:pyridoxine 5'-phosphate synthase [Pseudogulbenkiania sp. MAI-1]|uniref:pyridoxine 5'-phosphate synthase n=1 Tax=Pseudogulbenkiania sp. MAI-1 TaxID=990370 RepID=UPI000A037E54|nr:pyridoxine 5'-phosphate synthase [Pseudogulbenkiania sp. MAI-1]